MTSEQLKQIEAAAETRDDEGHIVAVNADVKNLCAYIRKLEQEVTHWRGVAKGHEIAEKGARSQLEVLRQRLAGVAE